MTWGIAISFHHVQQIKKSASTFIIVDILVAVALPVFLCTSIASIAVVLEYITIGHLDLRTIVPRLVGIVKFEHGKKFDYWIIDDFLYYPLKKKEDRSDKGCWFAVDISSATWFLAIIIGTAFNLVISYFVDLTLDTQITVSSCDDPLIDRTFDCFNASTLNFVDCVDNKQTVLLHCFKLVLIPTSSLQSALPMLSTWSPLQRLSISFNLWSETSYTSSQVDTGVQDF